MFRFIETIKFKDGKLHNLSYHNDRFRKTRGAFFSIYDNSRLEELIAPPSDRDDQLQKCRIEYGKSINNIEFLPYIKREVSTLKIVIADDIIYSYKYADRTGLENLFKKRENCDDILIVKKGYVTDSYYGNILFRDGKEWITPSTPLLKGTQREYLLHKGIIKEKSVLVDDIKNYKKLRLINAMNCLEDAPDIEIDNIKF